MSAPRWATAIFRPWDTLVYSTLLTATAQLAHTAPGRDVAKTVVLNDAAAAEPEIEALQPSFDRLEFL